MKGTGSPTFFRKAAKDFRDSSCSCIFFAFVFSYTAFTEATSPSSSEEKKNKQQKTENPPPLVKCSSFHLSPWCHTFLLLAKTYSKYFNIPYSRYYSYATDNSHKRTEYTAILAFLFIWGWMINSFKHVLEPQRSRSCTVRTHHSRMWNTKPYASFWSK